MEPRPTFESLRRNGQKSSLLGTPEIHKAIIVRSTTRSTLAVAEDNGESKAGKEAKKVGEQVEQLGGQLGRSKS